MGSRGTGARDAREVGLDSPIASYYPCDYHCFRIHPCFPRYVLRTYETNTPPKLSVPFSTSDEC